MDEETDAQKKEIDQKESPEGDVTGGAGGTQAANPALDAQKKEIGEV